MTKHGRFSSRIEAFVFDHVYDDVDIAVAAPHLFFFGHLDAQTGVSQMDFWLVFKHAESWIVRQGNFNEFVIYVGENVKYLDASIRIIEIDKAHFTKFKNRLNIYPTKKK